MNKGKIIVFEGLDCSFKETNAKLLFDYFMMLGRKVKLFSFPMYIEESSYFVKEYLKGTYGKDPSDVNSELASIFYMSDMFHTWKTSIEPLYNNGYIIIMDRFWTSNIYHQVSKITQTYDRWLDKGIIDLQIKKIINLATSTFKLPYADHTFLMRMNFDLMLDLIKAKNSSNDIHESKESYLRNVHNFYLNYFTLNNSTDIWCSEYNNKYMIDELKNKHDIFNDILEVVSTKILVEQEPDTVFVKGIPQKTFVTKEELQDANWNRIVKECVDLDCNIMYTGNSTNGCVGIFNEDIILSMVDRLLPCTVSGNDKLEFVNALKANLEKTGYVFI